MERLQGISATVTKDDETDQLLINGEYSASLVPTRCRQTPRGSLRWNLMLDRPTVPDIMIVARMDALNERPVDYYLLPMIDRSPKCLRLNVESGTFLDTYRFESLSYFVEMSARVRIEVAA